MSIIVIGTGRSGTNIVLEMLARSPDLKASEEVENKQFSKVPYKYPDNYLTKCDTFYLKWVGLKQVLDFNSGMKIVFTIRDPRDICLSKIYRGQPGKDTPTLSDDATVDGCSSVMEHMFDIYKKLKSTFENRLFIYKMEDILYAPAATASRMCIDLRITYNIEMQYFYKYMRNAYKRNRYKSIDNSQIKMWKNWSTLYDGFFKKYPIEKLFDSVYYICEEFGYV